MGDGFGLGLGGLAEVRFALRAGGNESYPSASEANITIRVIEIKTKTANAYMRDFPRPGRLRLAPLMML